jgi:two-component system response regulator FixJ
LERRQREIKCRISRLTRREREVMSGLLAGKPSKGIALELGIAYKTVLKHRARVLQKLGAESETEIVRHFIHDPFE